jgi:hypothetical protein
MAKMITALDTISGQVGIVPERYLTLPGLGDHLVRVDDGTKSYEPELYKATDADEYVEKKASRKKLTHSDPEETPDATLDSEIQ